MPKDSHLKVFVLSLLSAQNIPSLDTLTVYTLTLSERPVLNALYKRSLPSLALLPPPPAPQWGFGASIFSLPSMTSSTRTVTVSCSSWVVGTVPSGRSSADGGIKDGTENV